MDRISLKLNSVEEIKSILATFDVDITQLADLLLSKESSALTQKQKANQILLRPLISLKELMEHLPRLQKLLSNYDEESLEQAEIQIKYEVYVEKEKEVVARMATLEEQIIPDSFNYEKINSLSNEAKQKFIKIRPKTLGQASRISGVNPSDVQILMVFMGR